MPVFEEETNFPTVLGYKNYPPTHIRTGGIANKAIALVRGETPIHLAQKLRAQITEYPIIPFLNRPHPVLDMIKNMPTIIPRKKLIGVLGIVDPEDLTMEKNIPPPFGPTKWNSNRPVGPLPAVISILSGPGKTVLPEKVRPQIHVEW